MKYTTATIAAATMALASAMPQTDGTKNCNLPATNDNPPKAGVPFKLVALPKVANELQCAPIQALGNNLIIKADQQGANCSTGNDPGYATFILNGQGELFLNTNADGFAVQQIFVDRSGMGQGVIQYTTGLNETIGRNQERGPFKFNQNNDLVFFDPNGKVTAFQACPPYSGTGWELWMDGAKNPGGSKGCVGVNARAVTEENAVACEYSVPAGETA